MQNVALLVNVGLTGAELSIVYVHTSNLGGYN
jgi:hypothetical protein